MNWVGAGLSPEARTEPCAHPAAFSCFICYLTAACDPGAPDANPAWSLPSVSIRDALSSVMFSLQTVAEVTRKKKAASQQTTDVAVGGACSSAPSLAEYQALPHLLYISCNFPSFTSEWIGSFFPPFFFLNKKTILWVAGKIAILHGWLGSQKARRQWRSDRCGMDGAGPEVTEQRCCINHRQRCSGCSGHLKNLRW